MLSFFMIIDTPEEKREFLELYNNYNKDAYWTAKNILQEHHLALDAVQIAFMNMAKKFYLIQAVDKVAKRRYVCITTKNAAVNILRKEMKTVSIDESFPNSDISEEQLMESKIIDINDCERLMKKLNEINPSYREILVLRHYNELSYKEIGELFIVPLHTEGSCY